MREFSPLWLSSSRVEEGLSLVEDGLYQVEFKDFSAGDGTYWFSVGLRCEEGRARTPNEGPPGIGQFPQVLHVPTFERSLRFSGVVTGVP